MSDPREISVSIVSHTNVGKTTLARTLLREDVGEVLDRAHVTLESSRRPLVETPEGDRLVLWDTPGFGNSKKLLDRLEGRKEPISWLLLQAWDLVTDTPLWSSQQAVRNVRDEADVVLYLVNAAEDPLLAGYLEPELRILDWTGKPVLVLLNQTGPPEDPRRMQEEEARWRRFMEPWKSVEDVLRLDAFSRCWVQEGLLLERIRRVLPEDRREAMRRLTALWGERNVETFRSALAELANLVIAGARDAETPPEGFFAARSVAKAVETLARRHERRLRDATAAIVELHGLEDESAERLAHELVDVTSPREARDPWSVGIFGGAVGGLLGGVVADVASAGLSFGSGAVLGAILGALGLGGLSWAYEAVGGEDDPRVRWSDAFLDRQVRDGLLRYLAVAHSGRGGGPYRDRQHPDFWRDSVDALVEGAQDELHAIWQRARSTQSTDAGTTESELAAALERAALDLLRRFYPDAAEFLPAPSRE